MQSITVATVQMEPALGQLEENLMKMGEFIRRIATEQPVDLIIFPELSTTGYELGPRFPDMAQLVPGPAVNIVAQRAAEYGVHVAFGMVTKEKVESIIYNTAVLVGPDGEVAGQYHKIHLRGEEQMVFRPGYRIRPVEADFGVLGLIVGWDLAFPEVARSLVMREADVLAVLSAWEEPNQAEWDTYLKARAYENAAYVAAANRVGEEPSYTFFGRSSIVGPRGRVQAIVDEPIEGYAVARLDMGEVRRRREESQLLQCRQPSTYRDVVKKY
jgi:predicted amidohydrolase